MLSRKQWITQRLEYLGYLLRQLRPRHGRALMKFDDWIVYTMVAVNKLHSKIHIQSQSLRKLLGG